MVQVASLLRVVVGWVGRPIWVLGAAQLATAGLKVCPATVRLFEWIRARLTLGAGTLFGLVREAERKSGGPIWR